MQAPHRSTVDPAEIYSDGQYLASNADWHAEASPWKARQIEQLLARNHYRPVKVAEVGCGAGEILQELSRSWRQATFTGYELSPQAYSICKPKETERVQYLNTSILDDSNSYYDCLLCIDVFEHVEDYFGFLRGIRTKAEYKVFHIPLELHASAVLRAQQLYSRAVVGHLHYFSAATACATLQDCGYDIIDQSYTPLFRAAPGRGLGEKILRPFREALFPLAPGFLERTIGGCSLIVLAK